MTHAPPRSKAPDVVNNNRRPRLNAISAYPIKSPLTASVVLSTQGPVEWREARFPNFPNPISLPAPPA